MTEELLIKDAFDSIMDCDEARAMKVLETAERTGADLVELLIYGYSAGVEYLGELFSRGEVFLPKLITSTKVLKTVMTEFEKKMIIAEIKCAGIDYFLFRNNSH